MVQHHIDATDTSRWKAHKFWLLLLQLVFAGTTASASVLVEAHRGYSGVAPENTIASIEAGAGIADLTEWDVRITSDGAFVLMHDATVDRTTNGTGAVASLTLQEIQSLDAGSWFSPAFIDERVPTFGEAVDAALLHGLTPLIEPKAGAAAAYHNEFVSMGLLPPAFRLISFDWGFLDNLDSLNSDYNLGALGSGSLTQSTINTVRAQGADFIDWEHSTITQSVVDLVHANGMELHAWTVNSSSRMQQLIDMGVDGITTDLPATLNQLVILKTRTADLNNDNQVNELDWLMYNAGRGVDLSGMSKDAAYLSGDMDGDFDNDIADFVWFKELFLAATAPQLIVELKVPEPTAGMLFLTASFSICSWRRLPREKAIRTDDRLIKADCCRRFASFTFAFACATFLPALTSATTVTFNTAPAPVTNSDLPATFGSNVSAEGNGFITTDGTGATPNISLVWAPTGGTTAQAPNIDVLEFHSSATFSGAGFTVPVLQFDVDLSGHSALPADPTIDFNVAGGKSLRLNSFKIGNATDQTEPAYAWTINLIRLSDMTTVATRTTGLLDAGSLETVTFDYTGTPDEDYRLQFDDGGANAVRTAIDELSFSETDSGETPQLKLVVSTTTGQVELVNQSGQSFSIDSYEVSSVFGSLDPVGWKSLQDSDYEGNGPPGTGNGWEEASEVTSSKLTESYLLAESTIADGASIALGAAFDFNRLGVQQDLLFGYHVAGTSGYLTPGGVEYVSPVLDADFDDDGDVDGRDFLIWQRGFGLNGDGATPSLGNADGDMDVDHQDLAAWRVQYQLEEVIAAGSTPVPEYTSLNFGLAVIGIVASRIRSRHSQDLQWKLQAAVLSTPFID